MAPSQQLYLPNGQSLTVTPVFGGLFFRFNDMSLHSSVFPAGWTIIIQSEDFLEDHDPQETGKPAEGNTTPNKRHSHIHRFSKPTLHNDNLFISSISNPSSSEFKPAASPTRLIAMMLWCTLYWYFHQTEPPLFITNELSRNTPDAGKPRGEWKVNIKREGVFRGRNLLQKLERMGLITSADSSVGSNGQNSAEGWTEMFVSRRAFWQHSARQWLFTLPPAGGKSYPGSPHGSRPSSPGRVSVDGERNQTGGPDLRDQVNRALAGPAMLNIHTPGTPGPFTSGSHLPTYFPPPPLQYTTTNGVRHPMRPKPPRQGETFYCRFIPSVGEYLSFRVASMSPLPVAHDGPISPEAMSRTIVRGVERSRFSRPSTPGNSTEAEPETTNMSDVQLLNKWMNLPRVANSWACKGEPEIQEGKLRRELESKNSFPVIGCWDGRPFGYFQLYWVKEDYLATQLLSNDVDDWDRGVHLLVGEEQYRGKHRVKCWMSALAHWAFITDYRTNSFVLEPRVDNEP